jgi:hypothetical protein
MEQDRNWSETIRETSQFDDEITLPLRIVCERKPEAVRVNPAEEAQSKDVRRSNGNQKPVRVAVATA